MRVLAGADEVRAAVGQDLGRSESVTITVDRLAAFDDATGGAGIDWFLVSVSNLFLPQIVEVAGFSMGVNLGTDVIEFLDRPAAGDSIHGTATLTEATDVKGSLQTRMHITIATDDGRTCCTIDSLSRWFL